jgi:hypothetical protein
MPDVVRAIATFEDIDKPIHGKPFDRLRAFDVFV